MTKNCGGASNPALQAAPVIAVHAGVPSLAKPRSARLSFTVRFRSGQKRVFILASLVFLGSNALVTEAQTPADLRITEIGTCLIGNLDIPCSDVGEKLREMQYLRCAYSAERRSARQLLRC